ncbi:MAG: helix-turn-helix transcriptional regulator [Streptosporangiaceae bacterium]|jgi:DNA-binding PadR family transcriptional regulator
MSPVFRHGRLRLYLLRLLDEQPRHGYEVIRQLRDQFMGVYAPSPGTIYPRLARLEEEGLVTHDEVDGRKVYRITEAGREELRNRSDELDELEEELHASVSDIVREVKEDVRETVRNLREELTWAAREQARSARDEGREETRATRDATRDETRADREQAKTARDEAREQARRAAEETRDRIRAAREEARDRARQAREGARGQSRNAWDEAKRAWQEATREGDAPWDKFREHAAAFRQSADDLGGTHDWHGWTDWPRWTDWPGRKNWPGPHDAAAFRDLERLARDFVGDLRKVAWDSGAIGGDVLGNLRGILEDSLERIRTEIFGDDAPDGGSADSGPAGGGASAEAPGGTPEPGSHPEPGPESRGESDPG